MPLIGAKPLRSNEWAVVQLAFSKLNRVTTRAHDPYPVQARGHTRANLRANDEAVSAACEDAVAQLEARGKDVLYDDTDERPGGKFATADLIGVPWQLTIGPKGLADGVVELKRRATGEKVSVPLAEAIERLTA